MCSSDLKYINNLDAKDDTPIPVVKTGIGEKSGNGEKSKLNW